jgi:hypothetical protein
LIIKLAVPFIGISEMPPIPGSLVGLLRSVGLEILDFREKEKNLYAD